MLKGFWARKRDYFVNVTAVKREERDINIDKVWFCLFVLRNGLITVIMKSEHSALIFISAIVYVSIILVG